MYLIVTITVFVWNPATGGKRTWFETLNPNGGVIQVRPEFATGVKTHYLFNGTGG